MSRTSARQRHVLVAAAWACLAAMAVPQAQAQAQAQAPGASAPHTAACPVDRGARSADTLLTVEAPDGRIAAWSAERLRALGTDTWTEQRRVAQGTSSVQAVSVRYEGVRLRDVLAAADAGPAVDRAWRTAVIEAVATDGYRAVFSWGELFNAATGDQTIVVLSADGTPLDARAGPLALRALADQRPGPRHVRSLCALRVRPLV